MALEFSKSAKHMMDVSHLKLEPPLGYRIQHASCDGILNGVSDRVQNRRSRQNLKHFHHDIV